MASRGYAQTRPKREQESRRRPKAKRNRAARATHPPGTKLQGGGSSSRQKPRSAMGNSIGGRRKGAKVMQLDGTAFRVKPPATAGAVLRDHPGFQLLESEEVKLLGVRARPLAHDAQLRPGRLYFLVALPRPAAQPRRAWSGALHVGARERLESLMLTRRSTSDLSLPAGAGTAPASPLSTASEGGPVRLRMRLPKAQVEKLMAESRDGAEAAARIMQLCAANADSGAATPERGILRTPERSPRFVPTPDWGVGVAAFPQTPERSPRFAATPDWATGFMMPAGAETAPRTPERWPAMPRTPEYASPDVKARRKEKRTRFVVLPNEIIA